MQLTGKQKNYLRGLAHNINPIVTIGSNGLSDPVLNELEIALESHELLKVKLPADDKATKASLMATICSETNSVPVQLIGRVAVVFRPSKDSKIILPS